MQNEKDAAYKAEMEALQAEQRAATAQMREADRGLILVYTGEGKGKSSAAFGLLARAMGWGKRVGVVQFIKGNWKTGEKEFFSQFGPDKLVWRVMGEGFTWDTQDLARDRAAAKAALDLAHEMMASGEFDVLILDEVNVALGLGLIDLEALLGALGARSARTDVALTGRGAPEGLIAIADLVTEMREVKHPFQAGILAKRGVDY